MDDILSGGKIDQSTSGPVPPSRDDRDRDILLEQKERQDQDAIGGTQFPPRPQPLPPIPEATEVAPPLPVVPSFDFNISGSVLEEFREISRQTTMDILKNVNINGQSPSFEGSTISFNIPQQPPASEAFIFQGIMVPQPLPQVQTIQAPVLPPAQSEPAQEIQSFVVSPPPRQQPPQEARIEPVQEPEPPEAVAPAFAPAAVSVPETRIEAEKVEEPEQPKTPRTPVAAPPPPIVDSEVEQIPQQPATEAPTTPSVPQTQQSTPEELPEPQQTITNVVEQGAVPPPIKISTESDAPVLEQQKSQIDRPQEDSEAGPQQKPTQPRGVDSEDFGTGGKEGFLKPAYTSLSGETQEDRSQEIRDEARKRGADIDFNDAQKARDEARKENAVAQGFEEVEERKKRRVESDPDFDRESPLRQRGERMSDFRERQEELKKERAEEEKQKEDIKKISTEDLSALPSGMIPVKLTRADGQKAILAYIATEFVGVVEGAQEGERIASLPSEGSYYEAVSGGGNCVGLALYTKTVGIEPDITTQVWVDAGTVAGQLPDDFDPIDGKLIATGGSGDVWAFIEINENTGEIVSRGVSGGGFKPNNTNTNFYYGLGSYTYGEGGSVNISNYGCGSVDVNVCRNWFRSTPPFYGVSFSR